MFRKLVVLVCFVMGICICGGADSKFVHCILFWEYGRSGK